MMEKPTQEQVKEAVEKFMNTGVELDDPFWKLFDVKSLVNDSLLKAVEYGYAQGYEAAFLKREIK